MLKSIALSLIAFYQARISPKKGFGCAYRIHAGGTGCSGFGKRVIAKRGFMVGVILLRRRLSKCAWHAEQHFTRTENRRVLALRGQGGFVDCGGCDAPGCDAPNCDMPSCKSANCDMPSGCGGRQGRIADGVCSCLDVFSSCGGGGKGETRRRNRMQRRRDAKAESQG